MTIISFNSGAEILEMKDPKTGRTVYVDTPIAIAGCNPGLVMYKGWYVCKDKLPPPPPPPPPPPAPIYPPAGTVCRSDYPVQTDGINEIKCASGYIRKNRSRGDAWCEMTAAQKKLCTVIYPPAPPNPGEPTSGPGWQGGYLGSDGNMYNDPNGESLCGSCDRVIGHVGGDDQNTSTPETPQPDPNDSSTDGSENNSDGASDGE